MNGMQTCKRSYYYFRYVFSTEGHILPATPQISLAREHCSYLGSFCGVGDGKSSGLLGFSSAGETNSSKRYGVQSSTSLYSSSHFRPAPVPELLKVFEHFFSLNLSGRFQTPNSIYLLILKGRCPGLTYEQRYGLSFTVPAPLSGEQDTSRETEEPKVVASANPTVVSTNQNTEEYSSSASQTSTEA